MTAGRRAVYVYALADASVPPRMTVRGRRLETVCAGGLAAIVGAVERVPSSDVAALEEQHHVLVGLARRVPALLPARFGSHIDEARLRALLREHRATIRRALSRVRGCSQMTLRLFGEPDAQPPARVRAAGGAAYLQARRARQAHHPVEIATIRAELGECIVAEHVDAGRGRLRATVFHLVPSGHLPAYRTRASALQEKLAPVRMRVSGPWPPFAFAPELF